MNTKTIIFTVVIGLFWIFSLFWVKSCNKPEPVMPNPTEIKELNEHIAALSDSNKALFGLNAGLLQEVKAKDREIYRLKAQTASEVTRIDSTLDKDSTRALPEYRLALNKLGIETDEGPVTLRELGFGALFLTEVPGLRLQNRYYEDEKKTYEGMLANKDKIIANDGEQYDAQAKLTALELNAKDYYRGLYNDTQSFWYDRFNISLSAGAFWNGVNVFAGVGISAGISIWNSK